MGGIGISLQVSGDGDRAALSEAIWDAAYGLILEHIGLPPADDLDYYLDEGSQCGADGDRLWWRFSDLGGCCSRSEHAWLHWLELTFAADWDCFTRLAEEHHLTIVSKPPVLAEVLAGDWNFVSMRDDLWFAEGKGLFGDDKHVPIAELTADERARHAEARVRCQCELCTMLRSYIGSRP